MKKKALLSSILTIVLCLSLIAGSTFALFTSESKVDVAVTSGTVDVRAEILTDTLATSSMGIEQKAGTFENGGTATFDDNAKLNLTAVTPGDAATFQIKMTNNSDVTVQYRVKWAIDGKLSEVLVAEADGNAIVNNTSDWVEWTTEEDDEKLLNVALALPETVGNEYQTKTAALTFTVEAVQGNGTSFIMVNGVRYETADEAFAAAAEGDTVRFFGEQTPIVASKKVNLEFNAVNLYAATEGQNALTLATGFEGTVTMNGNNSLTGAKNGSAIYVEEGVSLNLTGDTLVAVGNNGKDYVENAPQYSSDDTASDYANTGASAIGGKGNINIYDMTSLTAEGYGKAGFGIGGATASITVKNTTVEFARGGYLNETGSYLTESNYLKGEPEGGAAIGSLTTGATITLDGVTVKEALGGSKAAGIGARYWTGVSIVIRNSTVEKVVGGNASAGIGGSRVASDDAAKAVMSITITDSNVNAFGGRYGAGIGSGYDVHCPTYDATNPPQPSLNIGISGGANHKITAVGGMYAAGIGTGYHNAMLTGSVTGAIEIDAQSGDKLYKTKYTLAQDIGFGVVDPEREAKNNPSSFNYKGEIITIPVVINTASAEAFANGLASLENSTEESVRLNLSGDVEWTTGAAGGSTPFVSENCQVKEIVIDGNGKTLKALGSGVGPIRAANGATLVFKNVNFFDESVSYAEDSWEYGYLEFAGNLVFENCVFNDAIMIEGESAKFIDCEFIASVDNQYAVWVSNGDVSFTGCTFKGTRGAKIHEAYGSEVGTVIFDACGFGPLSKKPGLAIGDVNAATTVEIKNCTFTGTQAGDQGNYKYETDTDTATFYFTDANNTVT